MTFSMPPRKAPWISLFVGRSCWSPVHTHNCLLSRGQFNRSNMQMPSSPAATHGPGTECSDPYGHMFISDPKSFAFDCDELRPPSKTLHSTRLSRALSAPRRFFAFHFVSPASCCKYAKMLQSADSTFGGPLVS